MPSAYLLLSLANIVFATSYSVTRVVLGDVPPATLGLARSVIGAVILVAWAWPGLRGARISASDHTALGYAVWNWCLERLGASRVAVFVNVQPLAGALIGVWWLREPLTAFTIVGGLAILTGLHPTVKGGRRE